VQTANQYYDVMVTQYAMQSIELHQDQQRILPNEQATDNSDDITVHLSRKYSLNVTNAVLQSMSNGNKIYVNWHSARQGSKKIDDRYCLDSQLVAFVLSKLDVMEASDFDNGYCLEGYTRIMTKTDCGSKILLYAHLSFQGREWYDWVYVDFEENNASGVAIENYYPARILGFVTIQRHRSSCTLL
jgi:hypothetical protein